MQTLDFSALLNNAQYFKKRLGNAKLCAVVKNNAYGHGIVHSARYLANVADCFAVGSVDEAKLIDFVGADILILLPQNEANVNDAIKAGYILTADSFDTLNIIIKVADILQVSARVHVKIDSGMSRLGFGQKDIPFLTSVLQCNPKLSVEGVYSHFYGENTAQCDKQLSVFLPCAEAIEKALNKRLTKHIANSNGALLSERYHLDMARIGLGLYGYGDKRLVPVKKISTRIVAVKEVDEGDVVGYGAKYVAPCSKRITVLNVGYAQGFCRALVGAQITINGHACKVVAVCMAMIMADVTDVDVKVGDEATLLGNGVNIENDIVSIYELLCNLK